MATMGHDRRYREEAMRRCRESTGDLINFGERVIQRDILAKEHGLSDRQTKALGHVLAHDGLTIHKYEALCPDTNRRTLQRDLKAMVDQGLLAIRGTSSTDPTKRYALAGGHRT